MTITTWRRARVGALALALGAGVVALAQPASAASPAVTVTSSINPTVFGQATTLKAKVTDPGVPSASITGTATFLDGATVIGTASVTNAVASLSTRVLAAGDHLLSASFVPTGGSTAVVSASLLQGVALADTTTALVTSRPSASYGNAGSITATVKNVAPAVGVATGTVDFYVDGGWYWTAPVDSRGKAVLLLADLYPSFYPGTYAITAVYSGDANHNGSTTAASLAQTIVGPTSAPVTTLTLDARGLPVFSPRSFTLSSLSPYGCNVTIKNDTPSAQALVYGTPGVWKRLPNGVIAAGGVSGVGVGIGGYTGYFSTMANTASYVSIRCT